MPLRNIHTWVQDLRGSVKSFYHNGDNQNPYCDEKAERQAHARETRDTLEGKPLSYADSGADVADPWKTGGDGTSDSRRLGNPNSTNDWPDLVPEPLRPTRGDTTKGRQVHDVIEPEEDGDGHTWSTTTAVEAEDGIEDLQKDSKSGKKLVGSGRESMERQNRQNWTLTPSDMPYRPTQLVEREPESDPRSAERVAADTLSRMYGSPYAATQDHIGMQDEVQRPSTVYQPDPKRGTLKPADSVSCVGRSDGPTPATGRSATQGLPGGGSSMPPQIPPAIHTSPRCSTEPVAQYNTLSPSHDVEMRPITSIPPEKVPESYRPEQPLNGRKAWLHALAGFLVVFNCWGISNSFGLFQAYYEVFYLRGASPASIAWIGSTQLALVFGLGVPVGKLVDKGYFKLVFHSGTIIMCLGLLSTSWCTSIGTLWLVQGLITGTGMGLLFCSGLVALMTWFDEKHLSMAMGLCAAGSCFGGIVYVLIARNLLVTRDFGTTMRVLAAVAAGTMIPANLIFRMRRQKHKDVLLGYSACRARPLATRRLGWRAFTEKAYLLVAAGMFFSFLGVYFGFVYIVTYGAIVLEMSTTASTNLLIFMLVANLPGRFIPAIISDKWIGPLNTIIASLTMSSAVIWIWVGSPAEQGSLTVIACFYGFVSAGVQVLYAPTMYSFCIEKRTGEDGQDEVGTDRIGIRAGGISTAIGLACLIGTPIGGALIAYRTDRGMDRPFLGAQIFAGVCLLCGAAFLFGSRVAKAGWTATRV